MDRDTDKISWYDVSVALENAKKEYGYYVTATLWPIASVGTRAARLSWVLSCRPCEGAAAWKRPVTFEQGWPTHKHRTVPGLLLALLWQFEQWYAASEPELEQLPVLSAAAAE